MDAPVPLTVGLVGMTWRFLHPVRPGDSIQSRWRLNRKRDVGDPRWGLAAWQVEVINQHGVVVATAEVQRLVARRGQTAAHDVSMSVEGTAVAEPGRSTRRRRRRRGQNGQAAPSIEVVEAAPPETSVPGPVEVAQEVEPAPSRRRRRRRGGQNGHALTPPPEPQPGESPASPPAAEAPAPVASRSRRRRRPPRTDEVARPETPALESVGADPEPQPEAVQSPASRARPRRRRAIAAEAPGGPTPEA